AIQQITNLRYSECGPGEGFQDDVRGHEIKYLRRLIGFCRINQHHWNRSSPAERLQIGRKPLVRERVIRNEQDRANFLQLALDGRILKGRLDDEVAVGTPRCGEVNY